MELKGQPRAAPAAYPLLSSHSADPFGVFRVSPLPRHEIDQRVLYIVDFRSSQIRGDQVCIERMHEARYGPTMWPGCGPRGGPLLHLVVSLIIPKCRESL
jgi:hypothetical protein